MYKMTLRRKKKCWNLQEDEEEEDALECTKRINRSEEATDLSQDTLRNE